MPEFTVDVTMTATIRVTAPTAEDALADVREIQGYPLDAQFNRGSMELREISVDVNDDSPSLFEE